MTSLLRQSKKSMDTSFSDDTKSAKVVKEKIKQTGFGLCLRFDRFTFPICNVVRADDDASRR